jgi:hypothetical protein
MWDARLLRCLSHSVCTTGYQQAVEAALWYEQCLTLQEARQLSMDSECLQIILAI